MPIISSNNKQIVKNTLVLYVRSIVVMIITLFTSRVVLRSLGIDDYGLSNVIGGVVALFAFLRTSMTKSTQRYLNVQMALPHGKLNETFCVSMNIHVVIALCTFLVAETIGLWFLNSYIQIPEGREFAANVIYQSTVLSMVFTVISVPYTADIIAHEEMGYFAVVSIIDAVLKLIIAYLIVYGSDRLVLYGILMGTISLFNLLMYYAYCHWKYDESKYRLYHNKEMTKSMLGYTTWVVVGYAGVVTTNNGNNILINMFHTVTANAAMGIASQVNGAVVSLTSNFQTAFNPQITKSYAAKEYDNLKNLVFSTSKISYFLLTFVSIPIAFNIDFILDLWLEEVPENSNIFCILILCNSILNALSAPLNYTVLSSEKIKWFQIITSLVYLSDLFIVYAFFLFGAPAVMALIVKVFIMVVVLYVRLHFFCRLVDSISQWSYFKEVLFPLFFTTILCIFCGYCVFYYMNQGAFVILANIILISFSSVTICMVGLSKKERNSFIRVVSNKFKRNKYQTPDMR